MTIRCSAALLLCVVEYAAGQVPAPAVPPAAASTATTWTEHYRRATLSIGRVVEDHGQNVFQVLGAAVVVALDAPAGLADRGSFTYPVNTPLSWHQCRIY
jgi:hypothetical protein